MTKLSSIIRVSTQGVSRPYICQDEDGCLFWCKGNHTGLKAVMSEWLCAKIAHAVALPVPACCIARLDPTFFEAWLSCNSGDFPAIVTRANPYVFASRNVEAAKDVINVAADLQDADLLLLGRIYLFDAFVRNTDRTDCNSNLLVNHGVHVIDHNNAFDKSFETKAFSATHILRSYFAQMPEAEITAFDQKLRDTVTESFVASAWSEMPDEWTDVGSAAFSLGEVQDVLCGGRA